MYTTVSLEILISPTLTFRWVGVYFCCR